MGRRIAPTLTTTKDVIGALGGARKVQIMLGLPDVRNVDNWKRAPTFPPKYFLVMTFALHQQRLAAAPELWGQVTPAQRQQALRALVAQQKSKVAA